MMKPYRYPSIGNDLKEERWDLARGAAATRESETGGVNGSRGVNGSSHASPATVASIALDPTRIDSHLVTLCDSDPLAAQQYLKLVASLMAFSRLRPPKRLLITSAKHGEGR